jgi:adenylate kinase family enzyme
LTALTLLDDELKIEESAHKGSITTALEVGNLKDLADITVSVLKEKMYLEGLAGKKCLIDGFPLSQVSLDAWTSAIGKAELCIFVDTSDAMMAARLQDRGQSKIDELLNDFRKDVQPVLDFFRSCDLLVIVDGSSSTDEMVEELKMYFSDQNMKGEFDFRTVLREIGACFIGSASLGLCVSACLWLSLFLIKQLGFFLFLTIVFGSALVLGVFGLVGMKLYKLYVQNPGAFFANLRFHVFDWDWEGRYRTTAAQTDVRMISKSPPTHTLTEISQ